MTVSVQSFFQEKIAAICSELDSQPADSTRTLHSFVGSELCGFEPVSQELVRKLICDSAPKSCLFDPIPTTLLKTYLNDLGLLIYRIVNESLMSGSVPLQFTHTQF